MFVKKKKTSEESDVIFADTVSNFAGVYTVFGTFEIISVHNVLNYQNRATNHYEH